MVRGAVSLGTHLGAGGTQRASEAPDVESVSSHTVQGFELCSEHWPRWVLLIHDLSCSVLHTLHLVPWEPELGDGL